MMSEQDARTPETTRTNPRWLAKTLIFFIVAVGLAGWFALDALVIYPKRGRADAEVKLLQYLEQANQSTQLLTSSVPQPKATLDALREKGEAAMTPVEKSRHDWLVSLSRVESLSRIEAANAANPGAESQTVFPEPRRTLDDLRARLASRSQPKPLSELDIPLQYAFFFLCSIVALWVLAMIIRVLATKFRYDHATATLTLPKGGTISAAELELLDKRKWDKFYAFLKVRGRDQEVKLDLYRYVPLEDWVLDMWRRSPNYDGSEDQSGDGDTPPKDDVGDAQVMSSADLPAM